MDEVELLISIQHRHNHEQRLLYTQYYPEIAHYWFLTATLSLDSRDCRFASDTMKWLCNVHELHNQVVFDYFIRAIKHER